MPSARKPQVRPAAPQGPPARLRLASLGPAWQLTGIFLVYLALRWYFLGSMAPVHFSDTASYVEQFASGFAQGVFGRVRSWGYPLFIWLCGHDLGVVVTAQRLAGAAAWFGLAMASERMFRSVAARRVAFWGVLLFALSLMSLIWDVMLLTESLSNTLFIALTAAWIWFLGSRDAGLRPLALFALLAVPFAGLRDSNVLILIFLAGCTALALAWRLHRAPAARPTRRVLWTAWGVVFLIFAVGAAHLMEMRRCHRNWQSVGAMLSLRVCMMVVGKRGAPLESHIDWLAKNYGMSVADARARLGKTVYGAPPLNPAYEAWLKQTGPGALIGFLIHHPRWVFATFNSSFTYGDSEMVLYYLQPLDPWRKGDIRLPLQIQMALHKTLDRLLGIPKINTLLSLAAALLGLAWVVRAWRRGPDGVSNLIGVLFMLTAVSAFMIFVSIFGDYNEPLRHAITGLLALYAAVPIVAAAACEWIMRKIKKKNAA